MSDFTPEKIATLQFIESHKPSLPAGDYVISVTQELEIEGRTAPVTLSAEQKFTVQGARFSLSPADVHSVYPPKNSKGDYRAVLPHILLNRSTLPWERRPVAAPKEKSASWLALLLFDETEAPKIESKTLRELSFKLETGQQLDDIVTTITVENSILGTIIPSIDDLEFLSHIRLSKDEAGKVIGEEKATIICNRLPKAGAKSVLHLVSLEDYEYPEPGTGPSSTTLVSLYNWNFDTNEEGKGTFKGLLQQLKVDVLRLPDSFTKDEAAAAYINRGFVPLRHDMRYGQRTVSWYHGPLAPVEIEWPLPAFPAASADELLHYNPQNGLFDVSYAAAWELGRKLALQDRKFATELVLWKKQLLLRQEKEKQWGDWEHIRPSPKRPFSDDLLTRAQNVVCLRAEDEGDVVGVIPPIIETFFDELSLLKKIPFDYLVAHEDMLPLESIRFFRVDPVWVHCLFDGAYSLGEDALQSTPATPEKDTRIITGFLLRSSVVSGWPGLVIDAEDAESDTLRIKRKEYLSAELLLVLFSGDLQKVTFSLAPDTLHFGLDLATDGSKAYWQVLRDDDGIEQNGNEEMIIKEVIVDEKNVLKVSGLARKIEEQLKQEAFSSADFALQMMEGAEKVEILRNNTDK